MISLITIILASISATSAIIAAMISYKNFERQKTFENENHLYLYKLEHYQKIIIAAYELVEIYSEKLESFDILLEKANKIQLNTIADEIDFRTNEFSNSLLKYMIFIPENILNKLNSFIIRLYFKGIINPKVDEAYLQSAIDQLIEQLDEILNLMRVDIGVSRLNSKLNKRIK